MHFPKSSPKTAHGKGNERTTHTARREMTPPSKSDQNTLDKNDVVEAWKPLALEARVRRGEVPVQEKFIRKQSAKRSTETTETVGTTPEDEEERGGGKTSGGFQKRTKKMKKAMTMKKGKRRNEGGEDDEEVQMCFQFLKNASCAKGETCRFSHDADYYRLKMKKKDLPGWCPFGSEKCPFGLACRFSGSHEDGFAPDEEDEAIALFEAPVANPRDDTNDVTNDVKYALARRTFDFSRADGILKAMGLRTSDEVRGGGDNNTNNRKDNDGKNQQQQKYKRMKTSENEKRVIAENADEYSDDDDDGNNNNNNNKVTSEPAFDKEDENKTASVDQLLKPKEKKTIDFKNKLYLAPLTTVGNLPFRRLCKTLGADITCGEMALATSLLKGDAREWALVRRHKSEDIFGVQICGGHSDSLGRCVQALDDTIECDFIDINMGCPIDLICNKGAGSMLLEKPKRMEELVRSSNLICSVPLTFKTRMGYKDTSRVAHTFVPRIKEWGASALTLHGRTRAQRYSREADWEYIRKVADASSVPIIGNGDIYTYHDYVENVVKNQDSIATCMIARGALVKPWIFTEIKEQRNWDISSHERFEILKDFARFGLEHWGSDERGVEQTRRFLLEWMSFTYRYTPVGILETIDGQLPNVSMTQRPPKFVGRDDMETMLASDDASVWCDLCEKLLGKAPEGWKFTPKHKSNAYKNANSESEGGMAFEMEANG
jgi:tRNA-dihydrouridine synthase 3